MTLLDFRLTVSTTVKQYVSVVLSHPVYDISLQKSKRLIQPLKIVFFFLNHILKV